MFNKAIEFFEQHNLRDRILVMEESTASAPEAASAINVSLSQIAKSLTFRTNEKPALIVMAGDAKIDSNKFRKTFKIKSKMLDLEEATKLTGYPIGGICPFDLDNNEIDVFLDISLKRNDFVYPGCGDVKTLIKLNLSELMEYSNFKGWIDIGKGWE
ncbi:MAG: YbaK/EbsC family protein [Erysipelotrichales bacterium]